MVIQIGFKGFKGIELALVSPTLLDTGKQNLERKGYRIASLEESAFLRSCEEAEYSMSRGSNLVNEDFIYLPDGRIFLTKNSPIMDNATDATIANSIHGMHYYLTEEQVIHALENSVRIPENMHSIPTNDFKNNEITAFAFGRVAENYGNLLYFKWAIKEMPIGLAEKRGKPFAMKAQLEGISSSSKLNGSRMLNYGNSLIGIKGSIDYQILSQ